MTSVSRRGKLARGLLLSLQLLAAHRLRTALSVSGLLVGVAAVIVMVAVGAGAERRVLERVRAMGTDLLVVSAAPAPRIAGRKRQVATLTTLRIADADAIAAESFIALAAAPDVSRSLVARWEGRNTTATVTGTTPEGLRMRNIRAQTGRLFDEGEDRERRRVAVVGGTVARNLFGDDDPVGREIRIGSVPFDVIGVMRRRGTDAAGTDLDNVIVVPLETAMRRVLSIPYVHALFIQAPSSARLDALEVEVREILGRRHRVRSGATEPFVILNQAVLLRTERGAARAMNQLIVSVAVLALLVGGIGILAVMLISVRERGREIGLRRAVGARRKDIQLQFLLESAMLAAAGGTGGVIAGLAVVGAAALLGLWELAVSWLAAALGVACSALLGVAAGVIPAARAARLQPIEALHAE
ncbi:MAG: ABC transporter permease [Gemmatimonadota bacterium]|nr:ABC transporter permease [Gemmatimonadota bacterium]